MQPGDPRRCWPGGWDGLTGSEAKESAGRWREPGRKAEGVRPAKPAAWSHSGVFTGTGVWLSPAWLLGGSAGAEREGLGVTAEMDSALYAGRAPVGREGCASGLHAPAGRWRV